MTFWKVPSPSFFEVSERPPTDSRRRVLLRALAVGCLVAVFFVFYLMSLRAPADFPVGAIVSIERGATLGHIADELASKGVIRSPFLFKALAVLFGGQDGAAAGEYLFKYPAWVVRIAYRVERAEYGLEPVSITIPEGTSVKEMADLFSGFLPKFSRAEFLKLASAREGYLFPDTYAFLPNARATEVIEALSKNFDVKIASLRSSLDAFRRPLREVIVMASLLEEEARTTGTRRIVAGILWERLRRGIPLQVDAVFPYIIGKDTFHLTTEDLATDSPYNTYRVVGLPPTPITNPGLDAILAAVTPIKTPYLFYLSDTDGAMHYAKTHEEHLRNREVYLGK